MEYPSQEKLQHNQIYTFNVKDFRPFPEIEAIEPKTS